MSTGKRIREERERLGYSQDAFATFANISRRSQIMYEQDSSEPSAGYFTAISAIGADILYILTGRVDADFEAKQIEIAEKRNSEVMQLYNELNLEQQKEVHADFKEKKRLNDLATMVEKMQIIIDEMRVQKK